MTVRQALVVLVLGALVGPLGGCHTKPTPVGFLPDPGLRAIAARYRDVVDAASMTATPWTTSLRTLTWWSANAATWGR